MSTPIPSIRVCIGTEPKTEIPLKVLQYSIMKHTKSKLKFYPMRGTNWDSGKPLHQGTGFSLKRWQIAEYFNFEGYAIYLDVDQILLTDINRLWQADIDYPNKTASIWCTYKKDKWYQRAPCTSVMFIDCEVAKNDWPNMTEVTQLNNFHPVPIFQL